MANRSPTNLCDHELTTLSRIAFDNWPATTGAAWSQACEVLVKRGLVVGGALTRAGRCALIIAGDRP